MSAAGCVLVPLLAAVLLSVSPSRWGARINLAAAALTLALAALLPWGAPGSWLRADRLGVHLAVLTAFVGLTTAWYSLAYLAAERALNARLYHAGFQAVLGFTLLALLSDNVGLTWAAAVAATGAVMLVVALPGTRAATEAAWRMFVLGGTALALALFGTVALVLAAQPALGPDWAARGWTAMSWDGLAAVAPRCSGTLLSLAFAFLLVGYGALAALAPLHAWLPDAQAAGPTPVSAILSGGLLNAALAVILRLRGVLDANAEAVAPGPPMMALGLLSALLGAFALGRQRDLGRFLAFSTVGQNGLAAFAFGLGGPDATFAGLLHLTVHASVKAALLTGAGSGPLLAAGLVALAGLPPFGLFASEVLILAETARRSPWLAVPLGLALVAGAWAGLARVDAHRSGSASPAALAGAWAHLALAALLGIAMPAPVAAWMRAAAAGLP